MEPKFWKTTTFSEFIKRVKNTSGSTPSAPTPTAMPKQLAPANVVNSMMAERVQKFPSPATPQVSNKPWLPKKTPDAVVNVAKAKQNLAFPTERYVKYVTSWNAQASKINEAVQQHPEIAPESNWIYPTLAPDVRENVFLFYDAENNQITSKETDNPYYLDDLGNLTTNPGSGVKPYREALFSEKLFQKYSKDMASMRSSVEDTVRNIENPVIPKVLTAQDIESSRQEYRDILDDPFVATAVDNSMYKNDDSEPEVQILSIKPAEKKLTFFAKLALLFTEQSSELTRDISGGLREVVINAALNPEYQNFTERVIAGRKSGKRWSQWVDELQTDPSNSEELNNFITTVKEQKEIASSGMETKSDEAMYSDIEKAAKIGLAGWGTMISFVSSLVGRVLFSKKIDNQALQWMRTFAETTGDTNAVQAVEALEEQHEENRAKFADMKIANDDDFQNYMDSVNKMLQPQGNETVSMTDMVSDAQKYQTVASLFNKASALDITTPDGLRQAVELTVQAQMVEATIGLRNVYASYTNMTDYDNYMKFHYAVAQYRIQKFARTGDMRLTVEEINQLKDSYSDPTTELVGSVINDVANFANMKASAIFSDDQLRSIAKMTGVTNVMERQVDGLIRASLISTVAKYVGEPAIKFARKIEFIDNFLGKRFLRNMMYGSENSIFALSSRGVGKRIFNDTTDLFNGLFGGATKSVKEVPQALFEEFDKLARDMATMKAAGLTRGQIISAIQTGKAYSPLLSGTKKLEHIYRLLLIGDVSATSMGWLDEVSGAYNKAVEERGKDFYRAYFNSIDFGDFTKRTPYPKLNRLLDEIVALPEEQQMAQLGQRMTALANKTAQEALTADEISGRIAAKFSEIFKEQRTHAGYSFGRYQVTLYDDSLVGMVDKWLSKSSGGGANAARQIISGFKKLGGDIHSAWVNNILSRSPKWYGVQQPIEQYMAFALSNSGTNDIASYLTDDVMRHIDDMPTAGRRGFASAIEISSDVDAIKYAKGLRKFFEDNPNAWKPTPGSYTLYFNRSLQKSYAETIENIWKKHAGEKNVKDMLLKNKFMREVAESTDNRLFGSVRLPDGTSVRTFKGKVLDVGDSISRIWKATAEAGAEMGSSNELITRAKIARRKFITDLGLMSENMFNSLSAQTRIDLISSGVPETLADDFIDNLRVMWNSADGNAYDFIETATIHASGNTPAVFATIPDSIQNMPIGMNMADTATFYRDVRSGLNTYLTGLFATGQEINEANIKTFFSEYLQTLKDESLEKINPLGFHGYNIFGNVITKKPVSNTTKELLDAIDNQTIEQLGYVSRSGDDMAFSFEDKLKTILADNGVDITGKTVTQALQELQEQVRPDWWVPPDIRQAAVLKALQDTNVPQSTKYAALNYELASLQNKYGDDFTKELIRNPEELMVGEKNLREINKQLRLEADNSELKFAIDRYDKVVGPIYGVRDGLRDFARTHPESATEALAAAEVVEAILTEDYRIQKRAMLVLEDIVPGDKAAKAAAKKTGGDVLEEYKKTYDEHAAFKFREAAGINAYNKRTEYLRNVFLAVKNGQPIPVLNHRTALEFWGIKPILDGNFDVIGITIADPVNPNGVAYVFGKDTHKGIFNQITNTTYLGRLNTAVLEAGIDTPHKELTRLRNSNVPVKASKFNIAPELIPQHREAIMKAYLSQPAFNENSLWFYINPFLSDRNLADVTIDEIVVKLKFAASRNEGESKRVIDGLIEHIESVDRYFYNNFIDTTGVNAAMPFFPTLMPDDMRAFAGVRLTNVSQIAGIESVFDTWADEVLEQNKAGLLKLRPITTGPHAGALNSSLRSMADSAVNMEEVLWHGGSLDGITIEGAIPFMEKNMRVSNETVMDQFAKGIVPFWNYATRGTTMWARFMMERPQIVRLYQQYLLLGRRQALQGGLTNSAGQPLPSVQGTIGIPGTAIRFNPMVLLSPAFAYFFPKDMTSKYDDDPLAAPDSLKGMSDYLRAFGVRLGPLPDIAISALYNRSGEVDQYTTQSAMEKFGWYGLSASVPTDLVPPFVWKAVEDALGYEQTGSFDPQVEWFDALVEKKIYEDLLVSLQTELAGADEKERIKAVTVARTMIQMREANPQYAKYIDEIKRSDYAKRVAGYMTGIYPKWFTTGAIEVYALRDELNVLRESINNEVTATIFFPEKQPSELYDLWNDTRYETALGLMWDIRNNVSWVETEDGVSLTGQQRREQINKNFESTVLRNEFYAEQESIYAMQDEMMRDLPIGTKFDDPELVAIRSETAQRILNLQADYPTVAPHWNIWSIKDKPQEMVEQIAISNVMRLVASFRPSWNPDGDISFPEYEVMLSQWEKNIPKEAAKLLPLIMQQLSNNPIQTNANQDVIGAIQRAVQSASIDTYNEWSKDNKSPAEALLDAYNTMYMDNYLDILYNMKNDARKTVAMNEWVAQNPPPQGEDMIAWVLENYGDRFTADELKEALLTSEDKPRDVLSTEDFSARYDTVRDTSTDEVYSMYGWIPQNRKSEFYKEMNLLNSQNDFSTFMDTGGNYPIDQERLDKLKGDMQAVLTKMGITQPQGSDLQVLAEAANQNDAFIRMATLHLGEGYADIVAEYGALESSNKRAWRAQYPDRYAIAMEYYDLRDTFAKQNPIWASVYTNQSSSGSTKYYGYGGRSSRRSGGRAATMSSDSRIVPVGMRSTDDANRLLEPDNLGKGGVAGMPKLPTEFWEKTTLDLRSEIYRFVNGESPLSQSGIAFLRRIIARHPEYQAEVIALIGEEDAA